MMGFFVASLDDITVSLSLSIYTHAIVPYMTSVSSRNWKTMQISCNFQKFSYIFDLCIIL